jgi:hypothetical protein
MLKIVLPAYSRGLTYSRKIEAACAHDVLCAVNLSSSGDNNEIGLPAALGFVHATLRGPPWQRHQQPLVAPANQHLRRFERVDTAPIMVM